MYDVKKNVFKVLRMKFLKIVESYVVNQKIYKYNIVFQRTILCSIKERGIRFPFCYEKRKR